MPRIQDLDRKELLLPLIGSALAAGGTFVAARAPEFVSDSVLPRLKGKAEDAAENLKDDLEQSNGAVGLAAKAADKLGRGSQGGGSRGQGWGKGRRLPIQLSVDVAVPRSFAYEEWTKFEKLGDFLHRVESVEEKSDNKLVWRENIWGRRREWRAEITSKQRNQSIAWKDDHGKGVLSFHSLAPRLTRIELNYDWMPHGVVEKLASGLQFHKRAAKTDLQRFKAYAETQYAAKHS